MYSIMKNLQANEHLFYIVFFLNFTFTNLANYFLCYKFVKNNLYIKFIYLNIF